MCASMQLIIMQISDDNESSNFMACTKGEKEVFMTILDDFRFLTRFPYLQRHSTFTVYSFRFEDV